MKKLGDLNPPSKLGALKNIKLKVLKVGKSIAIAVVCITGGVVTGTVAQAVIGQQTISDGKLGLVRTLDHTPLGDMKVIKVDGSLVSQIQTHMNRHSAILVNDVREVNSNPTISQRATLPAQAPLQHGKLKLKNDMESGALIFLHAPGEKKYNRYAYVPACSERVLLDEYNTRWRVSMDSVHTQQIGVVKDGVLVVATSNLVTQPDVTACNRGLRLQSRRVAATLANRPQDDVEMSRTTYRPVAKFAFNGKGPQFFGTVAQEITPKAIAKTFKTLEPERQLPWLLQKQHDIDNKMLDMSTEVLSLAGRKVNVKDQRELIEVARYLKGDGSDLQTASARLEQYIKDCYPTFASRPEALQFLTTLRTGENLKSNLQDNASPLLISLTKQSKTETPNTYQPIKSVEELNESITTAPSGPTATIINGQSIKCVQERPSVMTHPYSSI